MCGDNMKDRDNMKGRADNKSKRDEASRANNKGGEVSKNADKEGERKRIRIAPSILSADFARLADEIKRVEAVADLIHLDVMDGHFVPNITFGPPLVKSVRAVTDLYLDTHLMIEDPARYVGAFAEAGSDNITFHIEAIEEPQKIIELIREHKKDVGISLNPETPVDAILPYIDIVDMILFMSVSPGFGGQTFRREVLPKIEKIRSRAEGIYIEVDGGINKHTIKDVVKAGADTIVAGTAIFGAEDPAKAVLELREIAEDARRDAG